MLVRQLEEELRMRMRQPNIELQQQMEAIYAENEHLTREISILRDTIKVIICYLLSHVCDFSRLGINMFASMQGAYGVRIFTTMQCFMFAISNQQELELRIETQKQTLSARDESIKKLLEMLQNKGMGKCFTNNSVHTND